MTQAELIARAVRMTDDLCGVRCKYCRHAMRPPYLRVRVFFHWLWNHAGRSPKFKPLDTQPLSDTITKIRSALRESGR
ncbi:hypothetical protein LCGC14_0320040 [marine sediment metagenome]|uniref:Uncharacterized protein n=1 Tax=marine sediment metagenome TaxID=412755 RepID=A0A0F9W6V3_9ZZZZ